jgi:hypothetical protein
MRFIVLVVGDESAWESLTPAEGQAEMDAIYAWLEKHSDKILDGGAELDSAKKAKTVRRGVIVDGPYSEAKEVVGGLVFLETDTIDEAAAVAAEWPGVAAGRVAVEVRPAITR